MTRKTRADADRNERHILAVARAAFAVDGLDLPVREIARRAGLGVATVYRHFPSREDLVSAVLDEHVARCAAEMDAALADPDAWRALRGTVLRFAERQVTDRGLNQALLGAHPAGSAFAGQRRAHPRGLAELVERARAAGAVRGDVSVEDVRVCLAALASLPRRRAAAAGKRLAHLLLAGLASRAT